MSTLILARKVGESICIGNDVTLTITEVTGGQVRVSVNAPRTVPVHRLEVLREIAQANESAHGSSPARDALPYPARAQAGLQA